MKKIIRFLAKISGVEKQIKTETMNEIGNELAWEAYCFSEEHKVFQVVNDFGTRLKEGFRPDGLYIRKKNYGF